MLTSVGSDPSGWEGTHIRFELADEASSKKKKKTVTWLVTARKDGALLGEVR